MKINKIVFVTFFIFTISFISLINSSFIKFNAYTQADLDAAQAKIEELSKVVNANQKKITEIQDAINAENNKINKLLDNSGDTLSLLQRIGNSNILLLLFEEDGMDKFETTKNGVNQISSILLLKIEDVNAKMDKLAKQKEEIKQKQEENKKMLEDYREEYAEIQKELQAKRQSSIMEAQKLSENFYAAAGCVDGDVYGVDCAKGKITENSKFLRPLSSGYVTNEYGAFDIYDQADGHTGIDLASSNLNILPMADGIVIDAFEDAYGGKQILIMSLINGKNYVSNYAHLSNIKVESGDKVSKNEVIGTMGATGTALGVHLHFEVISGPIYIHSQLQNPRIYVNFPEGLSSFVGRE